MISIDPIIEEADEKDCAVSILVKLDTVKRFFNNYSASGLSFGFCFACENYSTSQNPLSNLENSEYIINKCAICLACDSKNKLINTPITRGSSNKFCSITRGNSNKVCSHDSVLDYMNFNEDKSYDLVEKNNQRFIKEFSGLSR